MIITNWPSAALNEGCANACCQYDLSWYQDDLSSFQDNISYYKDDNTINQDNLCCLLLLPVPGPLPERMLLLYMRSRTRGHCYFGVLAKPPDPAPELNKIPL